jgi:cell division protein FtsB
MLEDGIRRYGLLILGAALLAQMVFAEGGIIGYIKVRTEFRAIEAATKKYEQENVLLMREIDKLQKDDQYLEDVVRKKYGFVREGEKVYRVEK